MRLQTRNTLGRSGHRAASDLASNRRADAEFTLGLDEEWDDVPTANLEAESCAEATANVEPPAPESGERPPPDVDPAGSVAALRPVESAARATAQPSTPVPRDITTGTLLCNRYVLGRLLGTGGGALIFQAEDRRRIGAQDFGSRIAIKVLRPEMRNNTHALTRLRREFRQMQRLSHPGIARVYELACDEDVWFMTMELIEGQTINQWLKANTNRTAGLKVISACCEALHHAHEAGVVHGDLKPSNVLVLASGAVKLVDFGSAAERDASMGVIDKERSFAATPPYASPQVLAGEVADSRDDVFSLACLAYAVLTHGEHPFERKSSAEAQQAQLRPAYAPGLLPRQFEVLVRALAWDREQRPASVREFMHALLASDLRRDTPARDAASTFVDVGSSPLPTVASPTESKPTTDVKPEDVARLKAAVAAAEAQAERIKKAPATEQGDKPGAGEPMGRMPECREKTAVRKRPLERFKGYVAGPLASRGDEDGERSRPTAAEESHTAPKKKWLWPWQRSALFGVLLATGVAIVTTRAVRDTEPVRQAEERGVESSLASVSQVAERSAAAEPLMTPAALQVEEKKSPPVALKPKPTPAPASPEVSFTTRTLRVGAHQTVAALSVKRLNSMRGRVKVAWTIEEGTARRGVHYDLANPQFIEFLDGQSVRSLFIPLTPDENTESARHSKTFTVKLQQANGGPTLGEIKQVYVTIAGDVDDAVAAVGD